MLRCASSFVIAEYEKVRFIPQDSRALTADLLWSRRIWLVFRLFRSSPTMMRRGSNHPAGLNRTWLMTFNDMLTLLLTFFVLIISMSPLEADKVKGVAEAARKALGLTEARERTKKGVIEPFLLPIRDEDIEKERAKAVSRPAGGVLPDKREALARSLSRLKGVKILPLEEGSSLSLEETMLFSSSSAEILGEASPLLEELGKIINNADVFVRVEGNTDDLPVMTGQFPSNWELSMARAVNVVKYLISMGDVAPERLSAAGYADTRPKVPNVNPQNRQLNRRVEIIFTFPEK
jgi:chemotaxis protein MotB